MKFEFELDKYVELDGKTYDISYAIDEYIESDRFKKGDNYGEINPVANELDTFDWTTVHKDLGEDRIFKIENVFKEDDKYFVVIEHPKAIELLHSGNCKISKRSLIDYSGDIPKFSIITLDIVLDKLGILKYTAKTNYRLEKVKESDWFGHKVRLEYFTINDKNVIGYEHIIPDDFVNLNIDGNTAFKGDLSTLLYGNVKPQIFKRFLYFLHTKGHDVEIRTEKDIVENHYTESNIKWYENPMSLYKKEYEYTGLEVLNDENKYNDDSKVNFVVYTTNTEGRPLFIFYYVNTGDIIRKIDREQEAFEFLMTEFKLSLWDFTEIRRKIKDLELKNKKRVLNVLPFVYKTENLEEKINKLEELKDQIPESESDIVSMSTRGLITNLRFYLMNKAVNKYKLLGQKDKFLNLIYIGMPDDYDNHIFVSEDMKDILVEIPEDVLKDEIGINIQYNKEEFFMLGNDDISTEDCKKLFTVFYDDEYRHTHICVNMKANDILSIIPYDIIYYINETYGRYLHDTTELCKKFLDNVEKLTKIHNTIDKKELGEYFGLYKDGVLLSEEDDSVLDELVKIRRAMLDK